MLFFYKCECGQETPGIYLEETGIYAEFIKGEVSTRLSHCAGCGFKLPPVPERPERAGG